MLHEAALCILLMSNAAFSDASFPNLRYNSAVERDNGIAITHTKTQQTKMKVHVNVALSVSVCGYLPRVKCQFGALVHSVMEISAARDKKARKNFFDFSRVLYID